MDQIDPLLHSPHAHHLSAATRGRSKQSDLADLHIGASVDVGANNEVCLPYA